VAATFLLIDDFFKQHKNVVAANFCHFYMVFVHHYFNADD
jgi:hypothetical protein